MCRIADKDRAIVEPFVNYFLAEGEGSTSSDLNAISREGDFTSWELAATAVGAASQHGQ